MATGMYKHTKTTVGTSEGMSSCTLSDGFVVGLEMN